MKFVFMFFFLVLLLELGLVIFEGLLIKFGIFIVWREEVNVWLGLLIFIIWLVNLLGLVGKLDWCNCLELIWFVCEFILFVIWFDDDKVLELKCKEVNIV